MLSNAILFIIEYWNGKYLPSISMIDYKFGFIHSSYRRYYLNSVFAPDDKLQCVRNWTISKLFHYQNPRKMKINKNTLMQLMWNESFSGVNVLLYRILDNNMKNVYDIAICNVLSWNPRPLIFRWTKIMNFYTDSVLSTIHRP